MLPKVSERRSSVEIAGETVSCRSLTRAEVAEVHKAYESGSQLEAEALLVAYGTDTDLAETQEWLGTVPFDVVAPLVAHITELSGLTEGAQKSS